MEAVYLTTHQIINSKDKLSFVSNVIPNTIGFDLSDIEGILLLKQDNGQLAELTIRFNQDNKKFNNQLSWVNMSQSREIREDCRSMLEERTFSPVPNSTVSTVTFKLPNGEYVTLNVSEDNYNKIAESFSCQNDLW